MEEYTRKMKKTFYYEEERDLAQIVGDIGNITMNSNLAMNGDKSVTVEFEMEIDPNDLSIGDLNNIKIWMAENDMLPKPKSPNSKRFELEQRKTEATETIASTFDKILNEYDLKFSYNGKHIDLVKDRLSEDDVRRIVKEEIKSIHLEEFNKAKDRYKEFADDVVSGKFEEDFTENYYNKKHIDSINDNLNK